MSDAHLTPAQRAYFDTLRRLDPSERMSKHITEAVSSLAPDRKRPAARAFGRGLLAGLGFRRRR